MKKKKPKTSVLRKVELERENNARRQRLYRERHGKQQQNKSNKTIPNSIPKKLTSSARGITRSGIEKAQIYWRDKKRLQREKLRGKPQQLRRVREKDKERKRKHRQALRAKRETDETFSNKTIKNLTSVAKAHLPKSPRKYAHVVNRLATNTTPRKRKALDDLDLESPPPSKRTRAERVLLSGNNDNLGEQHQTGATHKSSAQTVARHLKAKAIYSSQITKQRIDGTVITCARKVRSMRVKGKVVLPRTTKKLVEQFYSREDIATPRPEKRYAYRGKAGYVMKMPVGDAYSIFRNEHPDVKLGQTSFYLHRPRQVRLLTAKNINHCVCPYCYNIRVKLSALNRVTSGAGQAGMRIRNEQELIDHILCPKSDDERFHSYNRTVPLRRGNVRDYRRAHAHGRVPLQGLPEVDGFGQGDDRLHSRKKSRDRR